MRPAPATRFQTRRQRSGWTNRTLAIVFGLVVAVVVLLLALFSGDSIQAARQLSQRAVVLAATGDDADALALATQAVALDPGNVQALAVAAESCERMGEPAAAVAWYGRLAEVDSGSRQRALLRKAQLLHRQLHDFAHAEVTYRQVLQTEPSHVEASTGLVELLAVCARRREAIPLILRLVQQGVVTDQIIILSQESAIISDVSVLKAAHHAFPGDANPLIGLAWHDANAEDDAMAIERLEQALELDSDCLAARLALGQLFLRQEVATRHRCERWLADLPEMADKYPEPWLVRAQLAEQSGQQSVAIRCYLEATRIAPELMKPTSRLAQLLDQAGESGLAGLFAEMSLGQQRLRESQVRVVNAGAFSSSQDALELISAYEQQGRLFEACGWCRLALAAFPQSTELRESQRRLNHIVESLPLLQTIESANVAAGVDVSRFPLPGDVDRAGSIEEPSEDLADSARTSPKGPVAFRDDAQQSGLRFRFFNGSDRTPTGRIFELTGGGIGVLDFDGDSWPDIFLTQGIEWPFQLSNANDFEGEFTPSRQGLGDRLYRNQQGTAFHDVSAAAGIGEYRFGQGVAAGDVNGDGFADMYVANIGQNRLWLNNGDGTFSVGEVSVPAEESQWTTSCAIADLDGDLHSDLFDVNYLAGDDVLSRVCPDSSGRPHSCLPVHFAAAPNYVLWNDHEGSFSSDGQSTLETISSGKGLGVAIWTVEGTGEPRVLIANDTTPNQLLVAGEWPVRRRSFHDSAFASGVALNGAGKAEGCMGIAVSDLNADGLNEFLVTNFLSESNTLFWQSAADFFDDRTREVQLHGPTMNVLGFGTQFLDADLDGFPELFVANGHVDDLRDAGKPYRMPPQLFRWDGVTFQVDVSDSRGAYFARNWLGRAAARIDWNRDGRTDLLVGHLDDDYALLTNTSPTPGCFISLKLIGTSSNRDAIGATVRVRGAQRIQFQQLMAGDGYQCSNERQLTFGVGPVELAKSIEVVWPSGRRQQFHDVPTSRAYLLVEGSGLLTAP